MKPIIQKHLKDRSFIEDTEDPSPNSSTIDEIGHGIDEIKNYITDGIPLSDKGNDAIRRLNEFVDPDQLAEIIHGETSDEDNWEYDETGSSSKPTETGSASKPTKIIKNKKNKKMKYTDAGKVNFKRWEHLRPVLAKQFKEQKDLHSMETKEKEKRQRSKTS